MSPKIQYMYRQKNKKNYVNNKIEGHKKRTTGEENYVLACFYRI